MRFIGYVLAAVGLVLLVFGLNAAGSPFDQVAIAVTGRAPDFTLWYLAAGAGALISGSALAAFGPAQS